MLKEAIEALEHCKRSLESGREEAQQDFAVAAARADSAAERRDDYDRRINEIRNGLLLLKNSDGLLGRAGDADAVHVTGPDGPNDVDKIIDQELKRLLD